MADVPAHAATRHLPLMDLRYPARRLVIYLAGTCGVPRAYLAPDLAPEPPGGYDLQLAERALLIRGSRHRRGGAARKSCQMRGRWVCCSRPSRPKTRRRGKDDRRFDLRDSLFTPSALAASWGCSCSSFAFWSVTCRVLPPSLFEHPAAELSVDDPAQLGEDRRQPDHIA